MHSNADSTAAPRAAGSPPTLTIAIPTYNRGPKAARLLTALTRQIVETRSADRVELLVSDNHSRVDPTPLLAPFVGGAVRTRFVRQDRNLEFDGNIRFLYEQATTDFVWFFGDDDLPLDGAVARVLKVLEDTSPDVLLFSFKQPPDLTVPQFDYADSPRITEDRGEQAERLMYYSKLTIYVLRRVGFTAAQREEIERQTGDGWMFIVLAMAVLESAARPRVAMLREFLARSDEDWHALEWTPTAFMRMHRPAEHPFARAHNPGLAAERRAMGLQSAIGICFYVMAGVYKVHDLEAYRAFVAAMPWQPRILLTMPRALVQMILLKLRLWPLYGPLLRRKPRRLAAAQAEPSTAL